MQRDMQIECHVRGLQTLTQFYQAWCFLRAHVFVSDLQRFGAEGVSSRTRARTTKRSHYFYFPLRAETCINTSSGSCPQIYHDFFCTATATAAAEKKTRGGRNFALGIRNAHKILLSRECVFHIFSIPTREARKIYSHHIIRAFNYSNAIICFPRNNFFVNLSQQRCHYSVCFFPWSE